MTGRTIGTTVVASVQCFRHGGLVHHGFVLGVSGFRVVAQKSGVIFTHHVMRRVHFQCLKEKWFERAERNEKVLEL